MPCLTMMQRCSSSHLMQIAMSTCQYFLYDKQHDLLCSHVQLCLAESHMMLASSHYQAHEWPWPGAMTRSILLATHCMGKQPLLHLGSQASTLCMVQTQLTNLQTVRQ